MKYYLIAGEASGDLHASRLMRAIKEKDRWRCSDSSEATSWRM